MMSVPSVDRGPSPMTLKEADERRRHRSVSAGEPPCGVRGIRRAFAYKGGMNRGWSNVAVGGAKFVATAPQPDERRQASRSEEHTSDLQSLMRNTYAVSGLKKTRQGQNI